MLLPLSKERHDAAELLPVVHPSFINDIVVRGRPLVNLAYLLQKGNRWQKCAIACDNI